MNGIELLLGMLVCAAATMYAGQDRGAYIGLRVGAVTPEFAERFHLPDTRGARVGELVPGGPGNNAGIIIDDVIREINGAAIMDPEDFVRRVRTMRAGAVIEVRFLRRGKPGKTSVTLGVRPADPEAGMVGGQLRPDKVPEEWRNVPELAQREQRQPGAQRPAYPTAPQPVSPQQTAAAAAPAPQRPAQASPLRPGMIRLRMMPIIDALDNGRVAYRLLVPEGWQLDGGVRWDMSCPSLPATVSARVFNPRGIEEIGILPVLTFVWGPAVQQLYPQGAKYLGAELQPTVFDPAQFIRTVVVPRFRRELAGARVVKQEELPHIAAKVAEQHPELRGRAQYRAGRMRFEYTVQGRPVEEDIYCLNYVIQMPMGLSYSLMWGSEEIRLTRAEKGKLDAQYPLFVAVGTSMRPDLQWYNRFHQVRQMLVQGEIQRSNRTVELSRYISRTNDQVTAMIRNSYEQRQASMERINSSWDQYIRGVDQYQNPWSGYSVQLPSGYNYAWSNAFGEYILANDPRYNPNIGSSVDWKPMQK